MTSMERRLRAIEQRYAPAVTTPDWARLDAIVRVYARELGVEPADLWTGVAELAEERAGFPTEAAYRDHIAADLGYRSVADMERHIEADFQRIAADVDRELVGASGRRAGSGACVGDSPA